MIEHASRRLPSTGQRCHVSVLFADVCGYTALNERCDPEDVAPVLEEVRGRVEDVVAQHGGTVNEWRGDGVLCVFGVPHASERDARRAIQAALELRECVRNLTMTQPAGVRRAIRFHIGLDSGLVFVRDGDIRRGRYELIGDAVNTAARLCAEAKLDEILVADTTLKGIEGFFELDPVPPLQLKGKQQPVRAWKVCSRTNVASRFGASVSRGLTPLVGRQTQLDELLERLKEVDRAGLTLISVIGAPGIGKTRLLEELRARAGEQSTRVLVGCCEDAQSMLPLQPFLQMLDQAQPSGADEHAAAGGDAERAEAASTRARLAGLLALQQDAPGAPRRDPDALQQAIVAEFEALFSALAGRGRLLLLLDDWQWADDSSRGVLASALRSLARRPVLVVVASRVLLDPLQRVDHVLELSPFTREESEHVVGALIPHAFDLGMLTFLHQQSGGNPLYLEELCRSGMAEAPASEEDLVSGIPATLNGLIRERVGRLAPREAAIVRAAAVLGGDFSLSLLQRLTAELDPPVTAEELKRSDVVYCSDIYGTFRFRHGINREVVYESIRLGERRQLHASAVRVLEENRAAPGWVEPLEALAHHCAGAQSYDSAAGYAERAGDKARATSSLDRARKHYRAALDALDQLDPSRQQRERWVTVAAKLATACLYRPSREAFAWLERMRSYAEALEDARAVARADYWTGWFQYAYGEQDLAMRHYHRALERARGLDDGPLEAQLLLNLGQSLAAAGEHAQANAHFERAIELRKVGGSRAAGNRYGLAYALSTRAMLCGQLGDFEQAYASLHESLRLVEATGHPTHAACLGALCLVQLLQADFSGCLETSVPTRAAAARVGGHFIFAQNQVIAGYARWLQAGSRAGLSEMLHGCQWLERRQLFVFGSFTLAHAADALLRAGDAAAAVRYAERALERGVHLDTAGEALAYRTLAGVYSQGGAVDRARSSLQAAFDCAIRQGSRRELALTQLCAAELSLEFRPAADALAEASASFAEMRMPFYQQRAANALALIAGRS